MNLSMFWQALILAWVFGVWIKSRYPDWWNKYVFVLGASLTTGVAVASLVQFFAITNANVTVSEPFFHLSYSTDLLMTKT